LNKWKRIQWDEVYVTGKHPEIKRRWSYMDGDHPWLKDWNPWKFDVAEDFVETDKTDLLALVKQAFHEGTINPMDDPDPDERHGLLIPEGYHVKDLKPPIQDESYRELGNKPFDPAKWK